MRTEIYNRKPFGTMVSIEEEFKVIMMMGMDSIISNASL